MKGFSGSGTTIDLSRRRCDGQDWFDAPPRYWNVRHSVTWAG